MNYIGYLAGILTLVGYLPQTIKTIRTRHTKDLSLWTFLIIGLAAIMWTIYGLYKGLPALWVPNGIIAVCSGVITFIKLIEG